MTVSIFVDFKKAFDCMNHQNLLLKLRNIGFGNKSLKWFSNYISNRTQINIVNGYKSEYLPVTWVPHGSILGPLLFPVFVNDLPSSFHHCQSRQYADDTVIYSSHQSLPTLANYLQLDLTSLLHWCKTNQMHINTQNNKIMPIGPKGTLACFPGWTSE